MTLKKLFAKAAAALCILSLTACATQTAKDYSDFKENQPRSILVLPPINDTVEVDASNSVLSQATFPLAESGYYVIPVTLMVETFKENGLTQPTDIQATPAEKLRQIFGADAALYISISKYGTVYKVIASESVVTAQAKLVDLKTGKLVWQGSATASSEEGKNNRGGLVSLLVSAVINQIIGTVSEQSHNVAGIATNRLLHASPNGGILYGQRSPYFSKK